MPNFKTTSRRSVLRGGAAIAAMIGTSGLALPALGQSRSRLVILASADNQVYYEYLKKQFDEAYPNVQTELQLVGYNQLYTKAASFLATGSSDVDIIEMDPVWTGDFARNNWALSLNDFISDAERRQFRPDLLDSLTSGGTLCALPLGTQYKVLFYNSKILEKLGLSQQPQTFEELAEVGQVAQQKGVVPYIQGFGWGQSEGLMADWTAILHAFGGTWFENGDWAFNNEAAVGALQFLVDQLAAGIFDPASVTFDDRTVMNPFLAGDYGAMNSWGLWGWNMSNSPTESRVAGDVEVGLMYGSRAADIKSRTCAGGGGFIVNRNSANADMAVEWIKRLAGIDHPENQVFALKNVGSLPATNAPWEEPSVLAELPVLSQISKQGEYLAFRPGQNVSGYQNWSNMVQTQLSAALTRQKSPRDALDAAVATARREFPPFGL